MFADKSVCKAKVIQFRVYDIDSNSFQQKHDNAIGRWFEGEDGLIGKIWRDNKMFLICLDVFTIK